MPWGLPAADPWNLSLDDRFLEEQGVHEELDRPVRIGAEEVPSPDGMRPFDRPAHVRVACAAVLQGLEEAVRPERRLEERPLLAARVEPEPLGSDLGISGQAAIPADRPPVTVERSGDPAVSPYMPHDDPARALSRGEISRLVQPEAGLEQALGRVGDRVKEGRGLGPEPRVLEPAIALLLGAGPVEVPPGGIEQAVIARREAQLDQRPRGPRVVAVDEAE